MRRAGASLPGWSAVITISVPVLWIRRDVVVDFFEALLISDDMIMKTWMPTILG